MSALRTSSSIIARWLTARREASDAFFPVDADRLARLCQQMSERFLANLDRVHPGVERMLLSARTGEGVDAFAGWLAAVAQREAEPA